MKVNFYRLFNHEDALIYTLGEEGADLKRNFPSEF
jgi:hypothetical protein